MAPIPRRTSERAALALTLALAALPGCRREGTAFDCRCEWLTDFDDPGKVKVRVCAADAEEAPIVGRGCAQSGTPAPVQSCACGPAEGAPPVCRHGCMELPEQH